MSTKKKTKSTKPKQAVAKPESLKVAPLDYEAAAAVQRREAIDVDVKKINDLEEKVLDGKAAARAAVLQVINAEIEQGVALQRICGHRQVNFDFMRDMEDRLPWWGSTKENQKEALESAQSRIALARRFNGKAVTWKDIEADSVKQVLQQVELLLPGTRAEMEDRAPRMELFGQWLGRISSIKADLEKSLTDKPLASRSKAQLEDFLSDTKYVEDYRHQAQELLEGK